VKAFGAVRVMGPLAAMGAALLIGVSSASAATPAHVQAVRGAYRMFGHTLPPGLSAGLLPQSVAAAASSHTALELFTNPVPLTINGVTYQMSMGAFGQQNAFGQPPQMEVGLARITTAHGRPTAEQDHVYGYSATGIQLSATSDLSKVRLNTGSAFAPTAVNTTFTQIAKATYPCTLLGGGHGAAIQAEGAISSKTFKIATGSSPFFGTITTGPKAATAFADPGCGSFGGSGGQIIFGNSQELQTCSGRETIQAGSVFGSTAWAMTVGFEGGKSLVLAATATSSQTESVNHLAAAVQSGSAMPPASHSHKGATAKITTAGNPMFSGRATFFSHHAPRISSVQRCVWEHHVYRFRGYRYGGGLKPVASNPLTALFDTGHFAFHGHAASLIVRRYLSR
jgi:hypothetical protein